MDWFPLQIFPGGGFDTSIMTVVFLGLLCIWWLTETFGFVFVGLVVPGYLASVFAISPTSAVVVIVESVATYGLVWFTSEFFGKTRVWSIFFGRDRFFSFLLVSLFVRLVGELWLWPDLWLGWTELTGISPHLPGSLNSVGLVLVPLTANMFWKLGLIRGVLQVGVPTAVVYVLSTYLLLPLTNLRFSEFQVHYEDVAIDILNSPKSYIIMLVTAVMAARANIRFGWDFGGILIPALIAISWFDIDKGLITLGEAVLLAWLAKSLMESKLFSQSNLEGPRRVVFVFTTGFLLKFVIAWAAYLLVPHVRVIDFFGFGYLLSSLLAVKIIQKKSVGLVMLPTIIVSVLGFLVGGAIAAGLSLDDDDPNLGSEATITMDAGRRPNIEASLVSRHAFVGSRPALGAPITPLELERFGSLIATIDSNARGGRMAPVSLASSFRELGMELQVVGDGDREAMVIGEPLERFPRDRGWGVYVYWPGNQGPVVEVAAVSRDPNSVLACLSIARAVKARALFFGAVSSTPTGRMLSPSTEAISPFHRAHQTARHNDIIQLRFRKSSRLWLGGGLNDLFPLGALTRLAGEAEVVWDHPDEQSIQRASAMANMVTMDLSANAVLRVADAVSPFARDEMIPEVAWADVERHFVGADRRLAATIPELGNALAPAQAEAAYAGVVLPLLRVAQQPLAEQAQARQMRAIRGVAQWLGLAVEQVNSRGDCYHVISEASQPVRGFGMALVRCDAGAPVVVQAPFPLTERSTWRFAMLLARDFDARAIALGSLIRVPGEALVGSPLEYGSLMTAVQRGASTLHGTGPVWTVQVRGLGSEREVKADVVASMESPLILASPPTDLTTLISELNGAGVATDLETGNLKLASLRGIPDLSSSFARQFSHGRFARFWLSHEFRDRLTPSPSVQSMQRLAARSGVEVLQGDLLQAGFPETPAEDELALEVLIAQAQRFAVTRNTLHLRALTKAMREQGLSPSVLMDDGRGQSWMVAPYGTQVVGIRLQRANPDNVLDSPGRVTEIALVNAAAVILTPSKGLP